MSYDYRFQLGMSSVDRAGVLFYPELFRHAHDAYEALMASVDLGLDQIIAAGRYAIPVVRAQADYHHPLAHGEPVTVRVGVQRLGGRSFTIACEFWDRAGTLCAHAETVHVLVDRETGTSVPIPDDWRSRLQHAAQAAD